MIGKSLLDLTLHLGGAQQFGTQLGNAVTKLQSMGKAGSSAKAILRDMADQWDHQAKVAERGQQKVAQSLETNTKKLREMERAMESYQRNAARHETALARARARAAQAHREERRWTRSTTSEYRHSAEGVAEARRLNQSVRHHRGRVDRLSGMIPSFDMDRLDSQRSRTAVSEELFQGWVARSRFAGGAARVAGIAAGAATAAAPVAIGGTLAVGGVLAAERDRQIARVFKDTEHTAKGMVAAMYQTIRAAKGLTMTFEDVARAGAHYQRSGSSVSQGQFLKTVDTISAQTGASADDAASALSSALNARDFSGLARLTGMDRRALARFTDGGEIGSSSDILGAIQRRYAGAEDIRKNTVGYRVKSGFSRVGKWMRGTAGEAYGAVFGVPEQDPEEEKRSADAGKVETYLTRLKEVTSELERQRNKVVQMGEAWAAIVSAQHAVHNSLQDMGLSIGATGFRGSAIEGQAVGIARSYSQASELAGGLLTDPSAAMNGFLGGAQGTVGMLQQLKGINMSLTGLNEEGHYTGSRATGRQAFLLRERAQRLRRGLVGAISMAGRSAMESGNGEDEAALRKIFNNARNAKTPGELQQVGQQFAQFQLGKAEEQSKLVEAREERKLAALESRIPDAIDGVRVAIQALDNYNGSLENESAEVQRRVKNSPEYRENQARIQRATGDMGDMRGTAGIAAPEQQGVRSWDNYIKRLGTGDMLRGFLESNRGKLSQSYLDSEEGYEKLDRYAKGQTTTIDTLKLIAENTSKTAGNTEVAVPDVAPRHTGGGGW